MMKQKNITGIRESFFLIPLLSLFLISTTLQAHGVKNHIAINKPSISQEKRTQAEKLTLELGQQISAVNKTPNQVQLDELILIAQQRQELLLEMLESAPSEVTRVALTNLKNRHIPDELDEILEHVKEIKGELEVTHEDFEDPANSRYRYQVKSNGKRYSLYFTDAPPAFVSGKQVIVKGLFFPSTEENDGAFAIEKGNDQNYLVLADGTTTSSSGTVPALDLTNTFGDQKTIVLLINFQDQPDEKPWLVSDIENLVFGEVNDFFLENSFGQTWLSGDVFGWFTLSIDSTDCSQITNISKLADQAANDAGIDLNAYSRIIYFHTYTQCSPTGSAQIGPIPSKAWINGSFKPRTVIHELGHNLGLFHSKFLDCSDDVIGTDCTTIEYGDSVDVMGTTFTIGHFNAFQKERLGWLNYGASPSIIKVTSDGNYTISPYSQQDNTSKALKILKDTNVTTGQKTWYYLEYRQPIGFDAQIPNGNALADNVYNGVVVHLGTESEANSSLLLDMTPQSSIWVDNKDTALEQGYSYSDSANGMTIVTDWVDNLGATVNVNFDQQNCTYNTPSIDTAPSVSDFVASGIQFDYTVTVTNNASSTCPAVTFDLASVAPSGWTSTFDQATLSLNPGDAATVLLSVTSPTTSVDGFYDINVTVSQNAEPSKQTSNTVTYVISNPPENQAPIATDDSTTTQEDKPVTIAVLANDYDPEGSILTIDSTEQGLNGLVTNNGDGSLTYQPNSGFSGTDSFNYTISDPNGATDTANVNITINAVNAVPTANDDSATTLAGTSVVIDVLKNDSDPDNDTLSVTSTTSATNGNVSINTDGTVVYTPLDEFTGIDNFSYSISDNNGGNASATVTLTVNAINLPPNAQDDNSDNVKGNTVDIPVLNNDSDPNGDKLTILSVSQASSGEVHINADNSISYTSTANAKGKSDSFTYTISDGKDSSSATVFIQFVKNSTASNGGGSNKGGPNK